MKTPQQPAIKKCPLISSVIAVQNQATPLTGQCIGDRCMFWQQFEDGTGDCKISVACDAVIDMVTNFAEIAASMAGGLNQQQQPIADEENEEAFLANLANNAPQANQPPQS